MYRLVIQKAQHMRKMVKHEAQINDLHYYYKYSLISEQYLFWINHGERVSGEVASIFENAYMYGKVVNVTVPSACIHTFFLLEVMHVQSS